MGAALYPLTDSVSVDPLTAPEIFEVTRGHFPSDRHLTSSTRDFRSLFTRSPSFRTSGLCKIRIRIY